MSLWLQYGLWFRKSGLNSQLSSNLKYYLLQIIEYLGTLGIFIWAGRGRGRRGAKEREWTALSQLAHLLSSSMYFIPVIQHYRSVPNHKHWIAILDSPLCVTAPYGQKVCIFNHLSWKSRWECAFGTAGQTSRPFWEHVLWVTKQIN